MAKGVIYVASTVISGVIKIGKTDKAHFDQRMTLLESNGYYNVGGIKREFAIEVDDCDSKEKLLHTIFSKSRIAKSELFALELKMVVDLLKAFDGVVVYPVGGPVPGPVVSKSNKFCDLNIPLHSKLVYTKDPSIVVETVDMKNHVTYNGKVYTLSGLVKELNHGGSWQGPLYFMYNGVKLTEL